MVAYIDFFEMSEICRPKFIVRHSIKLSGKNLQTILIIPDVKEPIINLENKE
jgi:hypothetical protein